MSLRGFKTILKWNQAYKSKLEREWIYCPNCRAYLNVENENTPNGSGAYKCGNCKQIFLVWLEDNGMDTLVPIEVLSKKDAKIIVILSAICILLMILQAYIWKLF